MGSQSHGSELRGWEWLGVPHNPPKKCHLGLVVAAGEGRTGDTTSSELSPFPCPPELIFALLQNASRLRKMWVHEQAPRCPVAEEITGVWRRAKGEGSGLQSEGVRVKGKGFTCGHRARQWQREGIFHPVLTSRRCEKSQQKPPSCFVNRSAFMTPKGKKPFPAVVLGPGAATPPARVLPKFRDPSPAPREMLLFQLCRQG